MVSGEGKEESKTIRVHLLRNPGTPPTSSERKKKMADPNISKINFKRSRGNISYLIYEICPLIMVLKIYS